MRRSPLNTLVLCFCALAGCQDYNFNPVGKCVIQPGSSRIELSGASTADILFVVDDSRSMDPLQANLARNFDSFISQVADQQAARIGGNLEPYEFHIAITTSSIFENQKSTACTGGVCSIPKNTDPSHALPVHPAYTYSCTGEGTACGDYATTYHGLGIACLPGVAVEGASYPRGDFVAAGSNPKVLHFTKDLQWSTWNKTTRTSTDSRLNTLVSQFKDNVKVGACGSGQEQHLEASRLAVKKALRQEGSQPGVDPSEWPHAGAKMVVVWVGNENDCSNPPSNLVLPATTGPASGTDTSLILDALSGAEVRPGLDTCTDPTEPTSDAAGKIFPLDDYVTFFKGLGRAFGAAFIFSAPSESCHSDPSTGQATCDESAGAGGKCPSTCDLTVDPNPNNPNDPKVCIAQGGKRFKNLSTKLRATGFDTVEGSICDTEFANTLQKIADLVTPVNALTLPTRPATSDVAVLRIDNADGTTRKFCNGPGSATPDWQFVDCKLGHPVSAGTTTACITINHGTGNCEATPGQIYVAQYLGMVPQPTDPNDLSTGGCAAASDCQAALGGQVSEWECFKRPGALVGDRGTCVCSSGT